MDCTGNCSGHGDCLENKCFCDLGWFGTQCQETFSGEKEWKCLLIIFGIVFGLLCVFSTVKLYTTMKPDKIHSLRRFLTRLLKSSKNLSLLCLSLIGGLRLTWILVDPLGFKELVPRVLERVLFDLAYGVFFIVYNSILLVWAGLYQGISSSKSGPFRILRKLLVVFMVLAVPVTLWVSIFHGLKGYNWFRVALGILVTSFVVLTLGYIAFALLLVSYLVKSNETYNQLTEQHFEFQNTQPRPVENLFAERIIKPSFISGSIPNSQRSLVSSPSNGYVSPQIHFQTFVKSFAQKSHWILKISKEDSSVFKKIVTLGLLSTLIGVSVLVISWHVSENLTEKQTIICLYTVLSLESFSSFLILVTFTTQIRVESKERLKFVSSIPKKQPLLRFPKFLQHIGNRLYLYFK